MMSEHSRAEPSGREFYPAALRERDWWVNWVLAVRHDEMTDDGPEDGAVPTKQPVAPYDRGDAEPCRWNSGLDEEEHPRTEFATVQRWDGLSVGTEIEAPERVLSDELGVGIITPVGGGEGRPITLLDWDDVRDPETGEVHPVCAYALEELDSYAEISQSGEGIHQFVFGEIPGGFRKYLRHVDDEPFVGDDRPMMELYCSGRLTAMTGRHVAGSGEDLVDGQELLNELCYRFRNNSNNSTSTPSHPFGDGEESAETEDDVPSTEEVGEIVATDVAFSGEDPSDWETGDAPTEYVAVLRGRDRKRKAAADGEDGDEAPGVANWELIRYAALLGKEAGFTQARVRGDLQEHPAWPEESDRKRCQRHIRSAWRASDDGRLSAPSVETLKRCGLLPEDYVNLSQLGQDDTLSGEQKWTAWSEARREGRLSASSFIPRAALRYLATDRGLYDFSALDEEPDELPPKAHNRALAYVNNDWAEDASVDLDDDDRATATSYKPRDHGLVRTWEDVRYIYGDSESRGRKAARELLSERYEFMTVSGTETLQVYDPETGVFTEETNQVRAEIYDGLGEYWSRHELNEIQAGLRQHNVVQPEDLDAGTDNRSLLCVENGVLDLLGGELHEHSPEYHFTSRVPQRYDPEAPTEPYEEFLDTLTEREADAEAMVEMVGHALMPDANERYKKFLILSGDADNGKSQFYKRVSALLNGPDAEESNTASVKLSKVAQNRFSKNSMYGAMANIAGEIDGKKIRKTAQLKDITGGDEVEIEPKGRTSFFDHINTTLMFAANDPPIIGERDKAAIASRIVPVELPYTFVDDPDGPEERQRVPENKLEERLETSEALSGFLNLALEGIQRLEANNGDVSLPESESERLQRYERSADPMREFGERCLTNDPSDYVVKADVETIYKEFATAQGHEVGQHVTSVLHNVLRGAEDLNYTESRPESPSYEDTDLPLRGWEERKRVINRATLTEEGLKYAKRAGLVESSAPAEESDDAPDLLTPSDLQGDLDAAEREKLPTVRGTVLGVWENRYGKPEAELVGEDGTTVDVQVVGYKMPATTPLSAEGEYELEGLRYRNPDDGRPYVELRPTTAVRTVEAPPEAEADDDEDDDGDEAPVEAPEADADPSPTATEQQDDSGAQRAADGGVTADTGPPDDATGPAADARRVARWLRQQGATMPPQALTLREMQGKVGIHPDDLEDALAYGAEKLGVIGRTGGEDEDRRYWVLE